MKNTYFLIETDCERTCADVISTFTNKKEAIKACRQKRNELYAANRLRMSEGSNERYNEKYFVTTTDDFVESTKYNGGFQKVPKDVIIF